LARAAALSLAIFAFVSLPLVGLSLSNMRMFELLQQVPTTVDAADASESARDSMLVLTKTVGVLAALAERVLRPVMAVGILAGLVCLAWLYRVYTNLPALGGRDLRFTPEWAVGLWFIPFAHFYYPYHVIREIWRASDPGGAEESQLEVGSPSALIGWWWAVVVSAVAFGFYYPFWAKMTQGDIMGVSTVVDAQYFYAEATGSALNIAAALLGILIITAIDRMQTEKYRMVSAGVGAQEAGPQQSGE
jgi:hypothetical protein